MYHGITVDGSTVSGNISGAKGGGVYTLSNLTLKGLQVRTTTVTGENNETTTTTTDVAHTVITGNRLKTATADDAAGVYMQNHTDNNGTGPKLYLKLSEGQVDGSLNYARITITGNKTVNGKPSDLRLPDKNNKTVNAISVMVDCGVQGEIRVVNAKKKLTRFGTMVDHENTIKRHGFTDEYKVFWSDDGELFGIINRSDQYFTEVIWGGDPICKITDANGRLLFMDPQGNQPAVYDILDDGDPNSVATTSAFGTLRSGITLYHSIQGNSSLVAYTGNEFMVKMLVEEYVAEQDIHLKKPSGMADEDKMIVTLTTAGSDDSKFNYRGREGTRSTVFRSPQMSTGANEGMLTLNSNGIDLTIRNIVLDGGADNGVSTGTGTRIIHASSSDSKITLSRNATLQKASVSGNGGGVYLNSGAQLFIDGGAIRNCSATDNGGGVYIDGEKGALTMTAGTITYCTADSDGNDVGNGGGVFFNKGKYVSVTENGQAVTNPSYINISGGSISRCSAVKGGGIYLNSSGSHGRNLFMSGGSIIYNRATQAGGGIAVGDNKARITFSGAPYISGNTCTVSKADKTASNVEMDRTFERINKPGTIIVSHGLIRGATVGVYVPGDDNNADVNDPIFTNASSLYDKHGAERDPFAIFEGTNGDSGMNYFINDRNGMKGGRDSVTNSSDMKIYWRKIYSLTVTKQVLSDEQEDANKLYYFDIQLSGTSNNIVSDDVSIIDSGTRAENVTGWIGGSYFNHGSATFALHSGETKIFDLLPLGFGYTIHERNPKNTESGHFQTSIKYWQVADVENNIPQSREKTIPGDTVTGYMTDEDHFSYDVTFYNLHAKCKITDENGRLLYTEVDGRKLPAVYSSLIAAFNKVNAGDTVDWYMIGTDGVYTDANPIQYRIEMLVDTYDLEPDISGQNEHVEVRMNKDVVFTTADRDADDGFPYLGETDYAEINRRYNGTSSMIAVESGSLTLENIILDGGNSEGFTTTADGGILHVDRRAVLTLGQHVTLKDSTTSGDGAGVYLEEGSTMNISGNPTFSNNLATGVDLGQNPKNGDSDSTSIYPTSTTAHQDIFLAGYNGATAESLVVTGNITAPAASIWVWAENLPHYIQNQQFAVLKDGIEYTGLNAFRNAQTDAATENPLRGDPKHLYGIYRDGMVFWSGSMDLTIVNYIAGDFANEEDEFTYIVTVSDLENGDTCDYAMYRTTDGGTTWELTTKSLTDEPRKLTMENGHLETFKLKANERIIISIPRGVTVTVEEEQNGYYVTSYETEGALVSAAEANTTGSITMSVDTTVTYTNTMQAVAPTAVAFRPGPYALLMAVGMVFPAVMPRRRRRRKEE